MKVFKEMLLINFIPNENVKSIFRFPFQKMDLPSKIVEQMAFNTRPRSEEHMLIVVEKSNHEEHQSQPQQTNNKKIKTVVTFSTAYNCAFNVTNKNIKFYFTVSVNDDDFNQVSIAPGA